MQCYPDTDILKQFIESSKHVFLRKIAQMRYEELEVIFLGQIFFLQIGFSICIHSCRSQTTLLTLFLSEGKSG